MRRIHFIACVRRTRRYSCSECDVRGRSPLSWFAVREDTHYLDHISQDGETALDWDCVAFLCCDIATS